MSSAPAGIDVREYAYDLTSYTVPDGAEHLLDAGQRWMVTRIQVFAPATLPAPGTGYIILDGPGGGQVFFQPGGCINLEPNGAFRDRILIFGSRQTPKAPGRESSSPHERAENRRLSELDLGQ